MFRQDPQRPGKSGRKLQFQDTAPETLLRRPGIIQGQVQHRYFTGKLPKPIIPVPLFFFRRYILLLPYGIIAITNLQRRRLVSFSPVQLQHFPDKNGLGNTVKYDMVYIRQERYEEAIKSLDAAERLLPDRAEVNAYRGFAHFSLGATGDARACWKAAAEMDPAWTDRFEALGLTL